MPAKAAASAVAFAVLVVGIGGGAFVVTREDPQPPPTTATTSTIATTTTTPDRVVADALAAALVDGLEVPLAAEQARCLGEALLASLGRERLETLTASSDPIGSLSEDERSLLVRAVVTCVGPVVAATLLGASTTTIAPVAFPDAGQE